MRDNRHARRSGEYTPKLPGLLIAAFFALVIVVVSISGLSIFFGWLSGARWSSLKNGAMSSDQIYGIIRSSIAVGTLMAGAFAIVYAYRKQRIDEAASFRADSEQLNKRYQDAANQLGHDKAAVRLAGVYAIGRLADDWPDSRSMCVDLLCAYLRTPYRSERSNDDEGEVRQAIFSLIRKHATDPEHPHSWSACDFDFRGGVFDQIDLSGAVFRGNVRFNDAIFVGIERRVDDKNLGWFTFSNCRFEGGLSFFNAKIKKAIFRFDNAVFSCSVHWGGATFDNFNLFFRQADFQDAWMYFGGCVFRVDDNRQTLGVFSFEGAKFSGAHVRFNAVELIGPVQLTLRNAVLQSGKLEIILFLAWNVGTNFKRPNVFIPSHMLKSQNMEFKANLNRSPIGEKVFPLGPAKKVESSLDS